MNNDTQHNLILFLLALIVSFASLEAALRLLDPVGVWNYYSDLATLQSLAVPYADGQRYLAGNYHLSTYELTINAEGLRHVDSAAAGNCPVTFLGDSVTFGMGANQSYVDVLARDLNLAAVNAGIAGYSAGNIAQVLAGSTASNHVWLIIQNDNEPSQAWHAPNIRLTLASQLYLSYYLKTGAIQAKENTEGFTRYADSILARADVLAFAFEGAGMTEAIQARYPNVIIIPQYQEMVSRFDAHPSDLGAQEIAAAMHPYLVDWLKSRCL